MKSMVYTFCQGIVWDDSDESLPKDDGELEIFIIWSCDEKDIQ